MKEFNKTKATKDGLQTYCRLCTRVRSKTYNNKYYTYERNREYNLRKYGISSVEFNSMLDEQYESCKICTVLFDLDNPRSIHVDHCHTTGIVRGLLCSQCNHLLGNARDSIIILESAIKYLITPRQCP